MEIAVLFVDRATSSSEVGIEHFRVVKRLRRQEAGMRRANISNRIRQGIVRIPIEHLNTGTMPFMVRPMEERDTAQSAEIERDAFPTQFPYTAFRRELGNKIARYLVAWRPDDVDAVDYPRRGQPLIGKLVDSARGVWQRRYSTWTPGQPLIVGFLGSWHMGNEAHIVSVGVRRDYRAHGIGELLLIGAIHQARQHGASVVTLEVRPSNHVARNLYSKYGFEERGLRKSYYSDNREDAIIMTTDPVTSKGFVERFEDLVEAHRTRWGRAEIVVDLAGPPGTPKPRHPRTAS